MKKIMSMVLAAATVLSMAILMSACDGGNDEGSEGTKPQTSNTDSSVSTEASSETNDNGSVFPSALEDKEAIEIPEIEQTGWSLAGGIIDGVEMEEGDVQSVLASCGGTMQFIFTSNKDVEMINGEQTFEGTYTVTEDKFAFHAVFTGYEYYGLFSPVDDTVVMIISNPKVPETALYLTQIDEH